MQVAQTGRWRCCPHSAISSHRPQGSGLHCISSNRKHARKESSLPPGPRTNRASARASCACGRGKASTPFSVLTSRPPCTRWDRSYQTPRQAEVRAPRPLTHEAPASRTEPQVLTRRCEASLCPVFSPPSPRPIVTFGISTPSGGWQREPEGTRIPPSVSRSHGGSALNQKQKLGAPIPASLCTTRDFRGQVI